MQYIRHFPSISRWGSFMYCYHIIKFSKNYS